MQGSLLQFPPSVGMPTQGGGAVEALAEGARGGSHGLGLRSSHTGHGAHRLVSRPMGLHSCSPTPVMALKLPGLSRWSVESREHPTRGSNWEPSGVCRGNMGRIVSLRACPCFHSLAAPFHVALLFFRPVPGMERCHLELLRRLPGVAFYPVLLKQMASPCCMLWVQVDQLLV